MILFSFFLLLCFFLLFVFVLFCLFGFWFFDCIPLSFSTFGVLFSLVLCRALSTSVIFLSFFPVFVSGLFKKKGFANVLR